ncbi:hypothetical protein [Ramlibacter tataouinensis]|uniref:Uncharacterized protein n=1 Tax=Ramlibacter tataouinensis TaxID=94132 RepID=A0A127JVW3_9BURK|nr:hypothetical protein [Ramlibacter tataouinensis]AMO24137.1 hypothetical protein UC35_16415 [Ramlibacter tataouinensis]
MQSNIDLDTKDAAALYANSIERERAARQQMESYPPGSRERAQACQAWAEAIVRTNRAWRCLSNTERSRPPAMGGESERPHASA